MDRLSHVNVKLEDDDDMKQISINIEAKQQNNDGFTNYLSINQVAACTPISTQLQLSQHSVQRCCKVKKEEEGSEIKLEWDDDECDCEEGRVEREIKIEFNQNNATVDQRGNNCIKAKKCSASHRSVCKRVKKEEEHDEEWDKDCDCDQCRRMRLKAILLGQTNATENQKDGGDGSGADDMETDVGKEGGLVGNNGNLNEANRQRNDASKGCKVQLSDESEDDETEIDEDEYEMDVDDEESSDDYETEMDELSDREVDDKFSAGKQVCKYCGKKFYRLARHILTHTGEKPFKCTWKGCKRTFPRKDNMKVHYATHIGKPPFKCSWDGCNKTFTQKFKMQTHYKAHTGGLPNVCEHCGKGFLSLSNLKIHIRTHTGEKPYKCPRNNCGRAFASKQNLNCHLKIHHV